MSAVWIGDLDWYLFGSVALGTADEYSDIDLMFEGPRVEDLDLPYWRRQREFLETSVPIVEAWLHDPVSHVLTPLTQHSNRLDDNDGLVSFACSYRIKLTPDHLKRLLLWGSHRQQAVFTSQREYEQRAQFKYGDLADRVTAWKSKVKHDV